MNKDNSTSSRSKTEVKRFERTKKWFYRNRRMIERVVVLAIIFVLLILFNKSVTQFLHQIDWRLVKEYVSVILTWPVAVAVVAIIFMNKFTSPISVFLSNINYVKAWKIEAGSSQASKPNDQIDSNVADELGKKGITLTNEQVQQVEQEFQKLIEDNTFKAADIQNKDQSIEWLAARAANYEFKFLALHLVPRTKLALLGLRSQSKQVMKFMDGVFVSGDVPDVAHEKHAVLRALQENELVSIDAGSVSITEKGKNFLQFINMG